VRIDEFPAGTRGGSIGLSDCPGKYEDLGSDVRQRLANDVRSITRWGARALVSALEDEELQIHGIQDIGATATRVGIWWFRVPLKANAEPDDRFWRAWPQAAPALLEILRNGQRVLIHSCGDIGRAKLVAGCLLAEMGLGPDAVLAAVRAAAPSGPLDSPAQELFLRGYLPRFPVHTRMRSE
jgi:ADP-ribosyl-[dinitrogen reductase] hydrolase